MEGIDRSKKKFGLVGRSISYSFSKAYFTKKFADLGLEDHSYDNFDLESLSEFDGLLRQKVLQGLNVTIPYKQEIIPYLDDLDEKAKTIGAVNTIKFVNHQLVGYNTDAYGFEQSLIPLLQTQHKKALILGTGGASKAITYVLDHLGLDYAFISRNPKNKQFAYSDLGKEHFQGYQVIVNCSPVGTFPQVKDKPQIPYDFITGRHLLYDLIYNPEETAFLLEGKKRGATVQNGLHMLQLQAEKAWEIWNS